MIAPLALAAAVLVVFLIVTGTLDGSDEDSKRKEKTTTSESTACGGGPPPAEKAVEDGYYVLSEGEDLTNVAERTCISVTDLQELNPNLDPLSLPVGGCVDLVVDGCKALSEN